MNVCVITGKEIIGEVHNASPIVDGKCSAEFNYLAVVPYRFFLSDETNSKAMLLNTDNTITLIKPKDEYFSLTELQTYVQGLIEMYPTYWNENFIVCNEEGLINEMEYNRLAKIILNVDLVGPVLVVPKKLIE